MNLNSKATHQSKEVTMSVIHQIKHSKICQSSPSSLHRFPQVDEGSLSKTNALFGHANKGIICRIKNHFLFCCLEQSVIVNLVIPNPNLPVINEHNCTVILPKKAISIQNTQKPNLPEQIDIARNN